MPCHYSPLGRTGRVSRRANCEGAVYVQEGEEDRTGVSVTPSQDAGRQCPRRRRASPHRPRNRDARDKGEGFCSGSGVVSDPLTGTGGWRIRPASGGRPQQCLGKLGPLLKAVDRSPPLCPLCPQSCFGAKKRPLPPPEMMMRREGGGSHDSAADTSCLPGPLGHTCPPRVGVREDHTRP